MDEEITLREFFKGLKAIFVDYWYDCVQDFKQTRYEMRVARHKYNWNAVHKDDIVRWKRESVQRGEGIVS